MDTVYLNPSEVTGDVGKLHRLNLLTTFRIMANVTFDTVREWSNNGGNIIISSDNITPTQVDNIIESFSTCTNFEVDASRCVSRTAASNDAIITILDNGGILFVNESENFIPCDAELHTDANAASDPNANEADAVTGWTPTGLGAPNEFISQSVVKSEGSYAFKINANPSPTNGAKISKSFTVVSGGYYRNKAAWRWLGTGEVWEYELDTEGTYVAVPSDGIFRNLVAYKEASSTAMVVSFFEHTSSNNGGLYVDSISLRKVTQ